MQSVDDLLRKNLKAFGERAAEKRRTAISGIWASDGVFVDPDGLHIGLEARFRKDPVSRPANGAQARMGP